MDQRVIDMVQSVEDCKPIDDYEYHKPRSKSVIDNGSLTRALGNMKKLEQDEKNRQADEQLKLVSEDNSTASWLKHCFDKPIK